MRCRVLWWRDAEEIQYVSKYVDHVYVDAEYTGAREPYELAVATLELKPVMRLELKEEFKRTKAAFNNAAATLDTIFHALRNDCHADLSEVQTALIPAD